MSSDAMVDAGRRWREANPDLARRLRGEPKTHGGGGVGKHGQVFNIPNDPRRREEWARWEEEYILNPGDASLAYQAARLGRSKAAITTKRWSLRQRGTPLLRLTNVVGTEGKGRTSMTLHPMPATYQGPCWQPDDCQMEAGRCQGCERRVDRVSSLVRAEGAR